MSCLELRVSQTRCMSYQELKISQRTFCLPLGHPLRGNMRTAMGMGGGGDKKTLGVRMFKVKMASPLS